MTNEHRDRLMAYLDAYNCADWQRLALHVSTGYVHHSGDQTRDLAGFIQGATWLRNGSPDLAIEVQAPGRIDKVDAMHIQLDLGDVNRLATGIEHGSFQLIDTCGIDLTSDGECEHFGPLGATDRQWWIGSVHAARPFATGSGDRGCVRGRCGGEPVYSHSDTRQWHRVARSGEPSERARQ